MNFSTKKMAFKGMKYFILFGVPFLLTNFPDLMNLTIGGVLVMFANFLKIKYRVNLP